MWKQQLCIGLVKGFSAQGINQLRCIKESGFDGFFAVWRSPNQLDPLAMEAEKLGLLFQSIHAPFQFAREMWENSEQGDLALQDLFNCLADCCRLRVPIMVVHPYKGFDIEPPTEIGIQRFGKLIDAAKSANIQIAFENVEGEEHLALLFEKFGQYENVGFCWDTGHEMCYNHSKDMLKLYGDKLIATHLNDNLGISRLDGSIYFTDDLHLLPFDGIGNWDDIAQRLNYHNFTGPLTFELSVLSKPNRHDNDHYTQLTMEQYYAQAYNRACRVAAKRGLYGFSTHN